jgi:hypothetical protein
MQQQKFSIPMDPALESTERYRDFLPQRRKALAQRMNEFIKEKSGT